MTKQGANRGSLFLYHSHADGEPPTADLIGVSLVEVRQNLFERGAVEAVGEDRSPANDVLTCDQLLHLSCFHLCLDGVADGVGFVLHFFDHRLVLVQQFDLGEHTETAQFNCVRTTRNRKSIGNQEFFAVSRPQHSDCPWAVHVFQAVLNKDTNCTATGLHFRKAVDIIFLTAKA